MSVLHTAKIFVSDMKVLIDDSLDKQINNNTRHAQKKLVATNVVWLDPKADNKLVYDPSRPLILSCEIEQGSNHIVVLLGEHRM
jgi:hypothetical protein